MGSSLNENLKEKDCVAMSLFEYIKDLYVKKPISSVASLKARDSDFIRNLSSKNGGDSILQHLHSGSVYANLKTIKETEKSPYSSIDSNQTKIRNLSNDIAQTKVLKYVFNRLGSYEYIYKQDSKSKENVDKAESDSDMVQKLHLSVSPSFSGEFYSRLCSLRNLKRVPYTDKIENATGKTKQWLLWLFDDCPTNADGCSNRPFKNIEWFFLNDIFCLSLAATICAELEKAEQRLSGTNKLTAFRANKHFIMESLCLYAISPLLETRDLCVKKGVQKLLNFTSINEEKLREFHSNISKEVKEALSYYEENHDSFPEQYFKEPQSLTTINKLLDYIESVPDDLKSENLRDININISSLLKELIENSSAYGNAFITKIKDLLLEYQDDLRSELASKKALNKTNHIHSLSEKLYQKVQKELDKIFPDILADIFDETTNSSATDYIKGKLATSFKIERTDFKEDVYLMDNYSVKVFACLLDIKYRSLFVPAEELLAQTPS